MTSAVVILGILLGTGPEAGGERRFFPTWPGELQNHVTELTKQFPGSLGLYVEDVRSRSVYSFNGDTPMYLASGIKIVVMMALYKAILEGRASFDETMSYRASDVRDGSPLLSYLRPGTPVTLGLLLETMIQSSDNAATDMVIRRVGIDAVNAILAEEGFVGFGPITSLLDVRRLVYFHLDRRSELLSSRDIFELAMTHPIEERVRSFEARVGARSGAYTEGDYHAAFDAYYREGWNSASMRSMGMLLSEIVRGRVVNRAVSARMLEIMRGTRTGHRRFQAGLPDGVTLAHKTGTQNRRVADFAVLFLPPDQRPVVMVAAIENSRRSEAERLLARIADAAVATFLGRKLRFEGTKAGRRSGGRIRHRDGQGRRAHSDRSRPR